MVTNYWHDISMGANSPHEITVINEISEGSKVKYEVDKDTNLLKLDRILHSSVVYPFNYGFIPQTLGDDQDPLDVLILCQQSILPLCLVKVRPIGMLKMIDQGSSDEKIVCVVCDDPAFNHYTSIYELPPHFLRETERFFKDYKKLEHKSVITQGFVGVDEAKKTILDSSEAYKEYMKKIEKQDLAMKQIIE